MDEPGITPADIARLPGPGLGVPVKVAFSGDGKWVAWLHAPDVGAQRELYVHDIALGATSLIESPVPRIEESSLSYEEKLRRERTREIGSGVVAFSWIA